MVGQVDTLINFCPKMVRFRIQPDFFLFVVYLFIFFLLLFLYFSFRFFSFVVIAAVQTEFKLCYFGNMFLSYAFPMKYKRFLNETNSDIHV